MLFFYVKTIKNPTSAYYLTFNLALTVIFCRISSVNITKESFLNDYETINYVAKMLINYIDKGINNVL